MSLVKLGLEPLELLQLVVLPLVLIHLEFVLPLALHAPLVVLSTRHFCAFCLGVGYDLVLHDL